MVYRSVRTRWDLNLYLPGWLEGLNPVTPHPPVSVGPVLVSVVCNSVHVLLSIWEIFIENSNELGIDLHDKENSHRTRCLPPEVAETELWDWGDSSA